MKLPATIESVWEIDGPFHRLCAVVVYEMEGGIFLWRMEALACCQQLWPERTPCPLPALTHAALIAVWEESSALVGQKPSLPLPASCERSSSGIDSISLFPRKPQPPPEPSTIVPKMGRVRECGGCEGEDGS